MGRRKSRGSGSERGRLSKCVALAVLLSVGGAPSLAGCGVAPAGAPSTLGSSLPAGGSSVPPAATGGVPTTRGPAPTGSAADADVPPAGWTPPSGDVLSAFTASAAAVACPLYLPAFLPPETVVSEGNAEPPLGGEMSAELAVTLSTGGGTIHVWEGIAGDVGDLPGQPCGFVGGRPLTGYSMLGGFLVQWSDEGWWYGVFSRDVGRAAVVGVAAAMERVSGDGP